jgi:hypothetical protein
VLSRFVGIPGLPTTVRGLKGTVQVEIPAGAREFGTRVKITQAGPPPTDAPYSVVGNAVAFAPPVNIDVTKGAVEPNQAKVTMTLPDGLPAAAYANAYIAIYEPGLGQFIPLMDSKPGDKQHTITATAPHFSQYQLLVNVGQGVTKRIIDVVDGRLMPYLHYLPPLEQAIKDIQQQAINDILGWGPNLMCFVQSDRIEDVTKDVSLGQLFEGCAEPFGDSSGRHFIKVANHYSFPFVIAPPKRYTAGIDSFDFIHGTLAEFLTQAVFANDNKAVAPGPGLAQLEMDAGTKLPSDLEGNLDWTAVAVDLTLFLATLMAPQLKAGTATNKPAANALLKALAFRPTKTLAW